MPDLATHALLPLIGIRTIELLKKRSIVDPSDRYLIVLGSICPDIIDKAVPYSIYYLCLFFNNEKIVISLKYLHTPFMLIVIIYMVCFCFQRSYRKRFFALIAGSIFFHLFLDLLQGNICEDGYMWLFPFSFKKPMIINLFYDDQTVLLVPFFFAVFILIEIIFRIRRRQLSNI